jgi:serpin B
MRFPDLRLFHLAVDDTSGSLIAPAPISDLLMFLYLGSAGETEAQFHERLFPALTRERIGDAVNQLVRDQPGFRTLSAWWVDPSTPLTAPFNEQGERQWGIVFHSRGILGRPLETSLDINEWFSTRTNGRVPTVITPADLTGRETVVAVTVSAFAGRWSGFDERDTVREPFHFSEDDKGNVWMMNSEGPRSYTENDRFQALSLPFRDTELEMLFILPRKPSDFKQILQDFDENEFAATLDHLRREEVIVRLPKVDYRQRLDLVPVLIEAGLTLPFDSGQADFRNMQAEGSTPLYISFLRQESWIQWNERGARAKAITSGGGDPFGPAPVPPPPKRFIANHPFAFFLYEKVSRRILFAGVLNNQDQFSR